MNNSKIILILFSENITQLKDLKNDKLNVKLYNNIKGEKADGKNVKHVDSLMVLVLKFNVNVTEEL